jgi:hypothetical protein
MYYSVIDIANRGPQIIGGPVRKHSSHAPIDGPVCQSKIEKDREASNFPTLNDMEWKMDRQTYMSFMSTEILGLKKNSYRKTSFFVIPVQRMGNFPIIYNT